jgi:hypothetical protein
VMLTDAFATVSASNFISAPDSFVVLMMDDMTGMTSKGTYSE